MDSSSGRRLRGFRAWGSGFEASRLMGFGNWMAFGIHGSPKAYKFVWRYL